MRAERNDLHENLPFRYALVMRGTYVTNRPIGSAHAGRDDELDTFVNVRDADDFSIGWHYDTEEQD